MPPASRLHQAAHLRQQGNKNAQQEHARNALDHSPLHRVIKEERHDRQEKETTPGKLQEATGYMKEGETLLKETIKRGIHQQHGNQCKRNQWNEIELLHASLPIF